MRIIRFRALKTFLITSKNLKRSLVAINIGIFLAIFAASSAAISLFVENELTDYEFSKTFSASNGRFNIHSSAARLLKFYAEPFLRYNQFRTHFHIADFRVVKIVVVGTSV